MLEGVTVPDLSEHALNLAALGWEVLPLHSIREGRCTCRRRRCGSPGKHPRSEHGVLDATSDWWVVRHWWRVWPEANLGVATGPASGVWVLGPDGPAGLAALDVLAAAHGGLPPTVTARTGGGGRHLYWRWPVREVTNRSNHRRLPIDVRGRGGYVVAPPSVNARGPYAWEASPFLSAPAEAPDWLLDWLRPPGLPPRPVPARPAPTQVQVCRRAERWLAGCPAAVSGQGGHGRTLWAARGLVWGFGLSPEESLQILLSCYNPRCVPPWSEKELWHKCKEAAAVPFGKARGWLLGA
jgi:hypothetical protein